MKDQVKKLKIWFYISITLLGISSSAILLVMFADFNGNQMQKAMGYLVGIIFWVGIIAGYTVFWKLNRELKKILKQHYRRKRKSRIGLITFFSSLHGMIADIICGICFLVLTVLLITKNNAEWLTIIFISLFAFSLQMHCLLNGENFKHIKFLETRSKRHETENEKHFK